MQENMGSTKLDETLEERVAKLEQVVYRLDVEDCPRCKHHFMNHWQPGICSFCAFNKSDLI